MAAKPLGLSPSSGEQKGTKESVLPNLLVNNLKSAQTLISALTKTLPPGTTLPPNVKSLAARVLAAPLKAQQGLPTANNPVPRGVVTATIPPRSSATATTINNTVLPQIKPTNSQPLHAQQQTGASSSSPQKNATTVVPQTTAAILAATDSTGVSTPTATTPTIATSSNAIVNNSSPRPVITAAGLANLAKVASESISQQKLLKPSGGSNTDSLSDTAALSANANSALVSLSIAASTLLQQNSSFTSSNNSSGVKSSSTIGGDSASTGASSVSAITPELIAKVSSYLTSSAMAAHASSSRASNPNPNPSSNSPQSHTPTPPPPVPSTVPLIPPPPLPPSSTESSAPFTTATAIPPSSSSSISQVSSLDLPSLPLTTPTDDEEASPSVLPTFATTGAVGTAGSSVPRESSVAVTMATNSGARITPVTTLAATSGGSVVVGGASGGLAAALIKTDNRRPALTLSSGNSGGGLGVGGAGVRGSEVKRLLEIDIAGTAGMPLSKRSRTADL